MGALLIVALCLYWGGRREGKEDSYTPRQLRFGDSLDSVVFVLSAFVPKIESGRLRVNTPTGQLWLCPLILVTLFTGVWLSIVPTTFISNSLRTRSTSPETS